MQRRQPPTDLLVLEPEVSPDASLPILRPDGDAEMVPKASREKRIALRTGLERLLGPHSFGGIVPAREHQLSTDRMGK